MAVQLVSCQCLAHGCCACIVHSVCCPPCHANVLYAHRCCSQHIAPVTALHSAREAGPLQDAHSKICNPGPADTGDTMLARKGYAFPMWFRAVTHVWKKPLNCRQTLLAWPQASWSCCSMLVLKRSCDCLAAIAGGCYQGGFIAEGQGGCIAEGRAGRHGQRPSAAAGPRFFQQRLVLASKSYYACCGRHGSPAEMQQGHLHAPFILSTLWMSWFAGVAARCTHRRHAQRSHHPQESSRPFRSAPGTPGRLSSALTTCAWPMHGADTVSLCILSRDPAASTGHDGDSLAFLSSAASCPSAGPC